MKCRFCDKDHGSRCPIVKAIEYFENGKVKRVEYMTPADYHPTPWPVSPQQPSSGL